MRVFFNFAIVNPNELFLSVYVFGYVFSSKKEARQILFYTGGVLCICPISFVTN